MSAVKEAIPIIKNVEIEEEPSVKEDASDEPEIVERPVGMVLAKTEFKGVVKTSYVILSIVNVADSEKKYQLHIGDKARQQTFPWQTQTVKPGYFLIDLPEGKYKFFEITIPVGTTKASESIDIDFQVEADKITYLGTLIVDGTKEKIKFGGVPVIKPGFEYTLEIRNEMEQALEHIKTLFPDLKKEIVVSLMKSVTTQK